MKRNIISLLTFLIVSLTVSGQTGDKSRRDISPEEMARKRSETLKAKLQLTDAQTTQVYNELVKTQNLIKQKRNEIKEARQNHQNAMKGILTPEQFEKLKENQNSQREMNRNRRLNRQNSGNEGDDDAPVKSPPPPKN